MGKENRRKNVGGEKGRREVKPVGGGGRLPSFPPGGVFELELCTKKGTTGRISERLANRHTCSRKDM